MHDQHGIVPAAASSSTLYWLQTSGKPHVTSSNDSKAIKQLIQPWRYAAANKKQQHTAS
jgi:hypothetical protein